MQGRAEAGFDVQTLCPRCGLEAETDFHRYWVCPDNAKVEDFAVKRTDRWMSDALKDVQQGLECIWLRGLVPSASTSFQVPQERPMLWARLRS